MASERVNQPKGKGTKRPRATTPEESEHQLINAATDLAERQLRDGSASAQVITHFLKLGSTREKLEQERLAAEVRLANAKIENMEAMARSEEAYKEALLAMRRYSGQDPEASDVPDDEGRR